MDVVALPVLSADASPRDVLRTMRRFERSGVVVETPTGFHLLAADRAFFRALGRRTATLPEVGLGPPLYAPGAAALAALAADLIRPFTTWGAYQTLMDQSGADYGILATAPGVALVLTRSEELGKMLGGNPPNCWCPSCGAPGGSAGGTCSACGATIECS